MESLKMKMNELKIRLEEARNRAERAEQEAIHARDRMESAEERASSLSRRIKVTEIELEKIVCRIRGDEKKLESAEHLKDSNKKEIVALAKKDSTDAENAEELEAKVKTTNANTEETEFRYEEACRHYKVREHQKMQVEKRLEHAQEIEQTLTTQIKEMTNKINQIRTIGGKPTMDEQEMSQRVHSLKMRCNEVDMRTEAAQRKAQRLNTEQEHIHSELASVKTKKDEAQAGLELIINDIEGI